MTVDASGPEEPKYNSKNPNIQSRQMGGSTPVYQTHAPNFNDLKAKHTAGYVNPSTQDRSTPDMFNFNGAVYMYQPESDAYQDTYTGALITSDNGAMGSSGIAGLYGDYEATGYTPQVQQPQSPTQFSGLAGQIQSITPRIREGVQSLYDRINRDRLVAPNWDQYRNTLNPWK